MKKKILSDIAISCDPPSVPYYIQNKGQEAIAKYYESWVREFDEFIRDHRSQDPVSLDVERIYTEVCSHCGYEWDTGETGYPCCCDKAVIEYEETQQEKAKESQSLRTTSKAKNGEA